MNDFLPSTDSGKVAFTANFAAIVVPDHALYSLAQSLVDEYKTTQLAFASAVEKATNPITKGPAATLQKNILRKQIVTMTRQIARSINNLVTVTDQQRQALGLHIRKVEPTPIGIPTVSPKIDIGEVFGSTVTGRIHNPITGKKTRPAGCANAVIFTYVGPTASENPDDYKWQGTVTRSNFSVTFPGELSPGTKVWIVAAYQNPKGEAGPGSSPVSALIAGGSISKMAA